MNTTGFSQNTKLLIIAKVPAINASKLLDYLPFALFILITLIWIVITYKIGDWRNWKLYYPTILFYWCGDLIYNVVFYKKPLWTFTNPIMCHHITDFLSMATVFTCTVLVFLPKYPKGLFKQIKYLSFWIFIYSFIEWIFVLMKGITYENGWTLGYSIIHNVYQFILLRIHHTNPILAWVLALIILMIIVNIFNVSFAE